MQKNIFIFLAVFVCNKPVDLQIIAQIRSLKHELLHETTRSYARDIVVQQSSHYFFLMEGIKKLESEQASAIDFFTLATRPINISFQKNNACGFSHYEYYLSVAYYALGRLAYIQQQHEVAATNLISAHNLSAQYWQPKLEEKCLIYLQSLSQQTNNTFPLLSIYLKAIAQDKK